jgi:uroporphyrinogen-III synthase
LREHGLQPAAAPAAGFGAAGAVEAARRAIAPGARVLRLRSDAAGATLAGELERLGARVTDAVIARNEPVAPAEVPPFEAVLFASRSAVLALMDRTPAPDLSGRLVAAIGRPTAEELERRGVAPVVGREATVGAALEALAGVCVVEALRKESEEP